jgi:hypothetical protein
MHSQAPWMLNNSKYSRKHIESKIIEEKLKGGWIVRVELQRVASDEPTPQILHLSDDYNDRQREEAQSDEHQRFNISSSDDLGFRNLPSAPDESAVRAAVHPTPTSKSYKDALRELLKDQMNWSYTEYSAVHVRPMFTSDRDTLSDRDSTPDTPIVCRCIFW